MNSIAKHFKKTGFIIAGALTAFVIAGCATTGEITRYWTYNQVVIGGPTDGGGGAGSLNTLQVVQKNGSDIGTFKITGQVPDTCLTGTLPVKIEETDRTLILLPGKTLASCYETRITINKDGSGGTVERKGFKSKDWQIAWPEHNWLLTAK